MAYQGSIQPVESSNGNYDGAVKFAVASGTTSSILPGDLVVKAAGAAYVTKGADNNPTTTARVVGVATSTSTETASAVGTVEVIVAKPGQLWMANIDVSTDIDTQAKYNALIGSRTVMEYDANNNPSFTMLSADGSTYGCVWEYNNISINPGKVVFSFSLLAHYLNV
jgi:hypothetical protein